MYNSTENNISIREMIIDFEDYNILNKQAVGQLILVLAYILEYIATLQSIQIINNKYSLDTKSEDDIDPDVLALLAAELFIIGQTILLNTSGIQYRRSDEHFSNQNANAGKSANYEIFLGDYIELIAYILNYIGVRSIYDINHQSEPDSPFFE